MKGDIIQTQIPLPEFIYATQKQGDAAVAGDVIAFDQTNAASGQIIKATATTGGVKKILTHLQHSDDTRVAYLLSGLIETTAGGKIRPNSFVKSDVNGSLIESLTHDADTVGIYLRRASDSSAQSDAAAGVAIIVRVLS